MRELTGVRRVLGALGPQHQAVHGGAGLPRSVWRLRDNIDHVHSACEPRAHAHAQPASTGHNVRTRCSEHHGRGSSSALGWRSSGLRCSTDTGTHHELATIDGVRAIPLALARTTERAHASPGGSVVPPMHSCGVRGCDEDDRECATTALVAPLLHNRALWGLPVGY